LPWPTPQDYNEAIQSPQISFNDPDLKQGVIETTTLGLPKPITGGFASVYRVKCKTRDWAVRCFLREFRDQQERYEAISRHLQLAKSPYIVGFEFLAQGIRIKGNWYPILKMEWVQGELLNSYIRKHIGKPDAFQELAKRWLMMIQALRSARIAHGDLQHGNVLVVNGDFRLIDYDGMYVPALTGKFSNEVGHRNYQHPQRTEFDFGPSIDNFSAWVIYVSLLALSIDSNLWNQMKAGDECLLFRREDFEEPFASKQLSLLSSHRDQRLVSLVGLFQSILYRSPDQVPAIDNQLSIDLTTAPPSSSLPSTANRPSWLYGQAGPNSSNQLASAKPEEVLSTDSTWVLDFISPPAKTEDQELQIEPAAGRTLFLAASSLIVAVLSTNVFIGLFATVATGMVLLSAVFVVVIVTTTGLWLRHLYLHEPVVQTMAQLTIQKYQERNRLEGCRRYLKDNEKRISEARGLETKTQRELNSRLTDLRQKEQREKTQANDKLNLTLESIDAKRAVINRNEATALKALSDRIGLEIARLTNSIAASMTAESNELSAALAGKQKQILKDFLSGYGIDDAQISGIGEKMKARLRYSGFRTARDIEYWSVREVGGIGDVKASMLEAWRQQIASRVKLPNSLTAQEIANIKAKYGSQRQALEKQRTASEQQLSNEVNGVKTRYANERKPLEAEQATAQRKTDELLQEITNRYASESRGLSDQQARLRFESNEQCRKISDEISKTRKQMSEHQWQLAKLERDLATFKNVSFKTYFGILVGLQRL
jgi:hypothetical protein